MYLASMVLKHHENQGREADDLPLVEWACRSLLYQAQEQLHLFLRNFPNRPLAAFMRLFIFPRGLDLLSAERPVGPRHRRSGHESDRDPGALERAHLQDAGSPHNPLAETAGGVDAVHHGGAA